MSSFRHLFWPKDVLIFDVILLAILAGLYSILSFPRGDLDNDAPLLPIALVVAIIVYQILNRLYFWSPPRRRHLVPGTLICFTGALLFIFAVRQFVPGDPFSAPVLARLVAAAATGAFLFLYGAVKFGTPMSVSMVVIAEDFVSTRHDLKAEGGKDVEKRLRTAMVKRAILPQDSFDEKDIADPDVEGPKGYPWVWPSHFVVGIEGTVTWHLIGLKDTIVTIRFNEKFDPFSLDRNVTSWFRATIGDDGATIIAAPTVRPGVGSYEVHIELPNGQKRTLVLGGGCCPRKQA